MRILNLVTLNMEFISLVRQNFANFHDCETGEKFIKNQSIYKTLNSPSVTFYLVFFSHVSFKF